MFLRRTFVVTAFVAAAAFSSLAPGQPPPSSPAAAAPAVTAPLQDPVTVAVADGIPLASVAKAVRAALAGRGWTVADEKPRYLEAVIDKPGQYVVRIGVAYDASRVAIRYVTSQGLARDPAGRAIGPAYNRWVRGLARDIKANLGGPAANSRSAAAPAPQAANAGAPPPPPVAGATVRIRPGAAIRGRPATAAAGTPAQGPVVMLKAPIENAEGRWWYVASGGRSGWVQEKDLRASVR